MGPEIKKCQNCGKEFTIEPQDFDFYEKISPSQIFAKGKNLGGQGVPAPTFCPACRWAFRLLWRNERSLYWRKCDLCGEKILAIYDETAPFPVYCNKCWWSDSWNPMDYGRDYDFSKPFFEQIRELLNIVPRINLNVLNNKNCPYVNQVWQSKNSYMCFDLGYGENVMYSKACHYLKDSVDCSYSKKIELCYDCTNTRNSSRSVGLLNCQNCLDCYFLKNCRNCHNCILCTNLRSKSYYILNKPLSKQEFERFKKEYINGSYPNYQKAQKLFAELCQKSIHKENENQRAINCSGNYVWDCKNCRDSFNVFRSEDCRFVHDVDSDLKDSMDVSYAAEGELIYNSCVAGAGSNISCSWMVINSHNINYSILCTRNNADLFGCVGLNYKQYCILNKQYTKDEYNNIVPRIIEQMLKMPYVDSKRRKFIYGDYFPPDLAPFAYNETTAQETFPLTKEQAIERGYPWRDPEQRDYKIDIKTEDIPDNIKDVPDDIVGKVIECASVRHSEPSNSEAKNPEERARTRGSFGEQSSPQDDEVAQCTTAFKIIPQELEFYRKMNLPLPRYCPNCRHFQRLKQRNPLKLWKRQCQCGGEKSTNGVYQNTTEHFHGDSPCPNTFQTTYSPDRPEIVYCKECYQREVV